MRKILIAVCVCLMAFLLVACGSTESEHTLSYVGSERIEVLDEYDCIAVYTEYTNGSSENAVPADYLTVTAYQNGVEIPILVPTGEKINGYIQCDVSVRSGVTVDVVWLFQLDDDSTVTIEMPDGEAIEVELATITEETQDEPSVSVGEITFDCIYEDTYEYAVITALSADGNIVWEYQTSQYERADLDRVSEIGWREDAYYFVEDGSVIAIDALSGEILWKNADFGGSGTGVAFGENAIVLCGQYGPDFYAVSYEGETIYRIEQFYEEYYWACEVELQDNTAIVYMYGGDMTWDDPVAVYVDLLTGTYDIYTESNDLENTQWKDAYIEYIETLEETNTETSIWSQYAYALVYVDDDTIPELFVNGFIEADGDRICTIGADGAVVECILSRIGGASYIEGSGLICNFNGNMGYYPLYFYKLENGVFTRLEDAYGMEVIEWDADGNETSVYSWNDEAVTEEEFYERWNSVMSLDDLSSPYEDTYSADEIIEMIQNM
ncbi:MAG: DUF5067 domain-containing protein [Oscillospiraceae bacterium]|nr:DUF5067 domain-containing protein [Oscillospiraceae bacterium]